MPRMTGPFYVEQTRVFRWCVLSRTATFFRPGSQQYEPCFPASHIATREDAEFICDAVNAVDAMEDERAPSGAVFHEGVRD